MLHSSGTQKYFSLATFYLHSPFLRYFYRNIVQNYICLTQILLVTSAPSQIIQISKELNLRFFFYYKLFTQQMLRKHKTKEDKLILKLSPYMENDGAKSVQHDNEYFLKI